MARIQFLDRAAPVEGRLHYFCGADIVDDCSSRVPVHCDSSVAEALGQFGNPEKEERPPLEAGTKRLVKIKEAEKTQDVL
jgi:hypothetical protein